MAIRTYHNCYPVCNSRPLMPAMNVFAWAPGAPMRIVLESPETPLLPMLILLSPVVRFRPAPIPNAMLPLPVVFRKSARTPTAVLLLPVVLEARPSHPGYGIDDHTWPYHLDSRPGYRPNAKSKGDDPTLGISVDSQAVIEEMSKTITVVPRLSDT